MTVTAASALDLVRAAEARLASSGNTLARRDAELLLSHILGVNPSRLPLYHDALSNEVISQFVRMVDERLIGKPVAYITGEQEFWSLTFAVNEHTLIPRPDTETLVSAGLESIVDVQNPSILDLGTGSGCVLLSLLQERGDATGVGIDLSVGALDVARQNATNHNLVMRARFLQSDWFDAIPADLHFDLIVSNPPYIAKADIGALMPDVRDFEPVSALEGGADGLECYRKIASSVPPKLTQGGVLAVEIGIGQAQAVGSLFAASGLQVSGVRQDLSGVDRVVIAKKA